LERLSKKWNNLIEEIKGDILSKGYALSVALVSTAQSQKINKQHRKKDKPTNVLSFALSKKSGEIIICPSVLKKEAREKKFDKDYDELFLFLVIHGMLHLDGMQHGSIMEKAEKFFCQKYDQKHFDRYRRRVSVDQNSSGRIHKRRKTS